MKDSFVHDIQIFIAFVLTVCIRCAINSNDVIKRLKADGWVKLGGKGDHEKFKHPDKPSHVVVPHPRKDLPVGTLRNIYRQAGWEWK